MSSSLLIKWNRENIPLANFNVSSSVNKTFYFHDIKNSLNKGVESSSEC